ncbi:MAG: hypothetical protein NVSMB25_13760 [Thermoleophilaceae bacterium]
MRPSIAITNFTDPTCPFAFSAEPGRWRLRWLYGDQIEWRERLVVLAESVQQLEQSSFTIDDQASGLLRLGRLYGMPIDAGRRPRLAQTADASRAVVAARLFDPQRSARLLRRLRIRAMAGHLLDEPEQIRLAADEAGVARGIVERALSGDPEVERELHKDMQAARRPSQAALALDHKLAPAGSGRRYTCPSYEIERKQDGARFDAPGFQPVEVYEAAIANLAPHLVRRAAPATVSETLLWAGEPLATVEVAAICEQDVGEVRSQLSRVAGFDPVGADGWWSATDESQRLAA